MGQVSNLETVDVAVGKNIGSRLSVGVAKAWWDGCYYVERAEVVPGTARVNSSLTRQEVLQMIKTLEEESLASSQNNFIVERSKGSTVRCDRGDNCSGGIIAAEGGDRVVSEDDMRGVHGRHVHLDKNGSNLLREH